LDSLIQDVKYAVRGIRGAKKLAAVIVATLALGSGANTAVFSVLHAVVLRPLPYDDPGRLVRVYHAALGEDSYLRGPDAVSYRERSQSIDLAILYNYSIEGADLTDRPEPERVRIMPVSADYFRVLGAHPLVGQTFERRDERPDARIAVVSERIWRKHLGGSSDVTGRLLTLNGNAYRVAAVLPGDFEDPLEPGVEVWTPLNLQPGGPNSSDNFYLSAIGRLRAGVTLQQAQAELDGIASALGGNGPAIRLRFTAHVVPLHTDTVGSVGPMLWILLGAVGLLLVIACVNVAGLLLARGATRGHELALRAALGCSGLRLVRQLLIESVLLALAGAAAGVVAARTVSSALIAAGPDVIARSAGSGIDRSVFVFSLATAVLTGLGFGVVPALQASRPDIERVLREGARTGIGSRRQTRARDVLVVCQVALALMLLVGAGLLLRSVERLRAVELGVRPAHVATFEVNLPAGRYGQPEQRARFYRELEARLAALPDVRTAAAISRLPVTGPYHSWGVRRGDAPADARFLPAQQRVIEGPYFDAVGIPILAGRAFGTEDIATAPRRVIVSQELVRQLFPGEEAVGRTLRVAGTVAEIIGVVGDVALGQRMAPRPYVYHSHSQFAGDRNWALTQVVALRGDAPSLIRDARQALAAIDPGLVLHDPRMLDEVIDGGVAQERFALLLLGSFAGLALVLAAVGIYGVLSYSVSQRTREMGIRMALGAPPSSVRALIVRDGGRLAAIGVALGVVTAGGATRGLRSLLFEVSATEPLVFASAAGVLVLAAMAASWIPARAATRADPIQAVKE
jgi:predicted permease